MVKRKLYRLEKAFLIFIILGSVLIFFLFSSRVSLKFYNVFTSASLQHLYNVTEVIQAEKATRCDW